MPWWVTGFCDRSGSFGLTMYKSKGKWYFKAVFEIITDIKDVHLLYLLRDFFGVGTVFVNKTATYRIADISGLMVIINHFLNYPLISYKAVTFELWSKAVRIISTSQHLVPINFEYIKSIYASIGRGASKAAMKEFPSLIAAPLPQYIIPVTLETINPWWISGYITLYCSFSLKIDAAGWKENIYNKFRHIFIVGFDIKNLLICELVANYLGITFYIRENGQRVDMTAQSSNEVNSLIKFLDSYPLQSYKNDQYKIWREYVKTVTAQRELDFQRKSVHSARFDSLIKLVDKLLELQKNRV
jgi:hypothetical protein